MRQAKKDKKCAKLVRGVLYLEGEMFTPSVESAYATDWTSTSHATQQTPRSDRQPNKCQRQLSDQLLLDRDPLENGQRRVAYKFLFLNVCGVKIKFNYQEFTEFIIM